LNTFFCIYTFTAHKKDSECRQKFAAVGDSTADGIAKGIARYDDALCSECIDAEKRIQILEKSVKQIKLDNCMI
jgi:hypothetical protein